MLALALTRGDIITAFGGGQSLYILRPIGDNTIIGDYD